MRLPALLPMTALVLVLSSAEAKSPHPSRAPVDFAYIINSGDGHLPGYRVYVGSNGSLSAVYLGRGGKPGGRRTGSLAPQVTRRFFADLAAAAPLDRLPFGTDQTQADAPAPVSPLDSPQIRITLRYHGLQSPNLRLAAGHSGQTLYQDVKQALQAVRLAVPNTP